MSIPSARHSQYFSISKTIQATVKGNDVTGVLTGNSYAIKVEISSPFTNFSSGSYIPCMARGHFSYDGGYGEYRGKQILEDLYYIAEYVIHKRDMLKAKLNENQQKIDRASVGRLTMDEFRHKRIKLRMKLRAKQITNVEYQRRVGRMRTEAESLQNRIWAIEEEFWDGHFQTIINMNMRDSIVEVLDGKRSLV